MVFIWRGWGFLTIPLIGVVIFAALWVTEALQLSDWAKIFEFAAIFLVAGLLNWKLGRFLNRTGLPGAARPVFHPDGILVGPGFSLRRRFAGFRFIRSMIGGACKSAIPQPVETVSFPAPLAA